MFYYFFLLIGSIVLFESLYCSIMKKKERIVIDNINNTEKKDVFYDNKNIFKRIKKIIMSLVRDFTFLLFKLVGYIPCHLLRMFMYKYIFKMDIGKRVIIYYGLETRNPWNIQIGDGSIIGDRAILDARYGIEIGNNVNISSGAWMWTLQHDLNDELFGTKGQEGKIIIGDRAWISSRTTILPGINVAEGCVVAAGAVVTKSIDEPYMIVGGIPAKVIGERNKGLNYIFSGEHRAFL